jgi:hypothetical protein
MSEDQRRAEALVKRLYGGKPLAGRTSDPGEETQEETLRRRHRLDGKDHNPVHAHAIERQRRARDRARQGIYDDDDEEY